MKVFGPLYPLPLQLAVNHAERFCTLLDGYEQLPPSSDENFVAWLTGRAGEVVRVVENAVVDWNDGQTADAAGMRIEQYLRCLHEDSGDARRGQRWDRPSGLLRRTAQHDRARDAVRGGDTKRPPDTRGGGVVAPSEWYSGGVGR